ncbi:MAG: hypothetical protein U1F09_14790 [Steroidobacteraceae bacterium]
MLEDRTGMATISTATRTSDHVGHDLARCAEVSICDLSGAEQFLVWAIRWRTSAQDDAEFAEECLTDSFSRAGMPDALPALREFVCAACPMQLDCPASRRLGCWRLNRLEAHALHAVACLQAGLIGEAWLTLRTVCPDASVPAALESLQAIGAALSRAGGPIRRWTGGPASAATRH